MTSGRSRSGISLQRTAGIVAAAVVLSMLSCRTIPGPGTAEAAYQFGEGYRWHLALPLIKQYLVYHPTDAGGHLLLARCYLEVSPPDLAVAAGELATALACFRQTGSLGMYTGKLSPSEFVAFIFEKRAKLHMRAWSEGVRVGAPRAALEKQLFRALDEVRMGLEFAPDSEVLLDMQRTLDSTVNEPLSPGGEELGPPLPRRPASGGWTA